MDEAEKGKKKISWFQSSSFLFSCSILSWRLQFFPFVWTFVQGIELIQEFLELLHFPSSTIFPSLLSSKERKRREREIKERVHFGFSIISTFFFTSIFFFFQFLLLSIFFHFLNHFYCFVFLSLPLSYFSLYLYISFFWYLPFSLFYSLSLSPSLWYKGKHSFSRGSKIIIFWRKESPSFLLIFFSSRFLSSSFMCQPHSSSLPRFIWNKLPRAL